MSGVRDSIGPVKPKIIPIFISAPAKAGRIIAPAAISASFLRILFLLILLLFKNKKT
jgi:hypothetical protein